MLGSAAQQLNVQAAADGPESPDYLRALLLVALIIVVARLGGALARMAGQPAVIGEIIAGIMLGPTLLGSGAGSVGDWLFPAEDRPLLSVLAKLGLILFMFIVGLEVDLSLVRGRGRLAFSVSATSMFVPFAVGVLLTLALHERHDSVDGNEVSFASLALFLGVAMSITAFPVLARILSERNMLRTPMGVLSLACAAVDDVLAWTLLAVVVVVADPTANPAEVLKVLGGTALFAAIMYLVVRPLLARLVPAYHRAGRLTSNMFAVILVGTLVSAFSTDRIGVHEIFGAFMFGAAMPREAAHKMITDLLRQVEQIALLLLLPVFFVIAGLAVNLRTIADTEPWELAAIIAVAIGGKFVGAYSAARVLRVPRRQCGALAVLMNTRGLTEIVVLTVGREKGILDTQLYTMLVVMAVVTTAMTGPLLRRVYPDHLVQRDIEALERADLDQTPAYTVLVDLSEAGRTVEGAALVALGCDLTGGQDPAIVALTDLVVSSGDGLEMGSGMSASLSGLIDSGDRLRRLGTVVTDRGLRLSVLSRFGRPSLPALERQAGELTAEVLLTGQSWPDLTSGERTIAILTPGGSDDGQAPSVVIDEQDTGTAAALRLGVAVARARGCEVRLLPAPGSRSRRRADRLAEDLGRVGVRAQLVAAVNEGLLLASADNVPANLPAGVRVVQVTPSRAEIDLDQVATALGEA